MNLQIVGSNRPRAGDKTGSASQSQACGDAIMSDTGMSETDKFKAEFMEREAAENM